jgi:hypothetical protein
MSGTSTLIGRWNIVNSAMYIDQYDSAGNEIPKPVGDLLEALVGDVQALMEAAERPAPKAATMSRTDALKLAREHVEAMSTNGRGYQDGVKLHDKVQAMERFARFLMGESE